METANAIAWLSILCLVDREENAAPETKKHGADILMRCSQRGMNFGRPESAIEHIHQTRGKATVFSETIWSSEPCRPWTASCHQIDAFQYGSQGLVSIRSILLYVQYIYTHIHINNIRNLLIFDGIYPFGSEGLPILHGALPRCARHVSSDMPTCHLDVEHI